MKFISVAMGTGVVSIILAQLYTSSAAAFPATPRETPVEGARPGISTHESPASELRRTIAKRKQTLEPCTIQPWQAGGMAETTMIRSTTTSTSNLHAASSLPTSIQTQFSRGIGIITLTSELTNLRGDTQSTASSNQEGEEENDETGSESSSEESTGEEDEEIGEQQRQTHNMQLIARTAGFERAPITTLRVENPGTRRVLTPSATINPIPANTASHQKSRSTVKKRHSLEYTRLPMDFGAGYRGCY